MEKYEFLSRHGAGSYAVVWKAKRRSDGRMVAIKQLKDSLSDWDEVKRLPEIRYLSAMRSHPHVVKLEEVVRMHDQVFLVFEYCDGNLYQTMQGMLRAGNSFRESQIRWIMRDVLTGLDHVHSKGCIHRDIKPENILLSASQRQAKLCDFGQAKSVDDRGTFTAYVSTRWYRAPELMLKARRYGAAADMWAVGTLMAELYAMRPIFAGTSEIDQLFKIASVIGPPRGWRHGEDLAHAMGYSFPTVERLGLRSVVPAAGPDALSMMAGLLQFDPTRRMTAAQALRHPFMKLEPIDPVMPIITETRASDEAAAKEAAASFVKSMASAASFREHNMEEQKRLHAAEEAKGEGKRATEPSRPAGGADSGAAHHGAGRGSSLSGGKTFADTESGRAARANHEAYLAAMAKARGSMAGSGADEAAPRGRGHGGRRGRGGGPGGGGDGRGGASSARGGGGAGAGGGLGEPGRPGARGRTFHSPVHRRAPSGDSPTHHGSNLVRSHMGSSRLDLNAGVEADEFSASNAALTSLAAPPIGAMGRGSLRKSGRGSGSSARRASEEVRSFGLGLPAALASTDSPTLSPLNSPFNDGHSSAASSLDDPLADATPMSRMLGRPSGTSGRRGAGGGGGPSSLLAGKWRRQESAISDASGHATPSGSVAPGDLMARIHALGGSFDDVSFGDVGATLGGLSGRPGRGSRK